MRKLILDKDFKHIGKPVRSTKGSAGYDLKSLDTKTLPPHSIGTKVNTGVFVEMPEDEVFQVYIRSGIASKYGIRLSTSVGIIDSDFKHHISLFLDNLSDKPFEIKAGDRLAQGIFTKYFKTDDDEVTAERNGGMGSTGR